MAEETISHASIEQTETVVNQYENSPAYKRRTILRLFPKFYPMLIFVNILLVEFLAPMKKHHGLLCGNNIAQ